MKIEFFSDGRQVVITTCLPLLYRLAKLRVESKNEDDVLIYTATNMIYESSMHAHDERERQRATTEFTEHISCISSYPTLLEMRYRLVFVVDNNHHPPQPNEEIWWPAFVFDNYHELSSLYRRRIN